MGVTSLRYGAAAGGQRWYDGGTPALGDFYNFFEKWRIFRYIL